VFFTEITPQHRHLYDFANDVGYVALDQVAENREGWIQTKKDVISLPYSRRLLGWILG